MCFRVFCLWAGIGTTLRSHFVGSLLCVFEWCVWFELVSCLFFSFFLRFQCVDECFERSLFLLFRPISVVFGVPIFLEKIYFPVQVFCVSATAFLLFV